MAKPIFTVSIHNSADKEDVIRVEEMLMNKLPDYHVLIYLSSSDEPKFQTFYDKDFTEVNYEEMKEIIKKSMNA
jgi:uncharacterized pyridoxamine 5'-phosphate oxidase family protein